MADFLPLGLGSSPLNGRTNLQGPIPTIQDTLGR